MKRLQPFAEYLLEEHEASLMDDFTEDLFCEATGNPSSYEILDAAINETELEGGKTYELF